MMLPGREVRGRLLPVVGHGPRAAPHAVGAAAVAGRPVVRPAASVQDAVGLAGNAAKSTAFRAVEIPAQPPIPRLLSVFAMLRFPSLSSPSIARIASTFSGTTSLS